MDKVIDIINSAIYSDGKLNLNISDFNISLDHSGISVTSDKLNVKAGYENNVNDITLAPADYFDISNAEYLVNFIAENIDNMPELDIDIADIKLGAILSYLSDDTFNFDFVKSAIENKKVALSVDLTVSSFDISGVVTVDFNDLKDIKVSAELTLNDTLNISVFFEDSTVFVKVGNIALKSSIDTISDYLDIFGLDISSMLNTDGLMDKVIDIINSIIYNIGSLSFDVEDFAVTLSHTGITVASDKLNAKLSYMISDPIVALPQADYVSIAGLEDLISKIYAQLSNRYFTANGNIKIGKVQISLQNIKIHNKGDLADPTAAFNNGDLTLGGTVLITANGKTHKLYIQYSNATLYIIYNDTLKVKLSRTAMDEMVDLIKSEYKNVIQSLNYGELLSSTDVLTLIKEYDFKNLDNLVGFVKSLSISNGILGVNICADDLGLDYDIDLKAYVDNGNLALDVSIDEKYGHISLNNNTFANLTTPSGSFIDLSNVKGLVKGLVNVIENKSGTYYLSGTAKINVIGIIERTVNVDAAIRLIDDGAEGKKIEAVAHISLAKDILVADLASNYIKCGDGTLIYKDGYFYIKRLNYSRSWFQWSSSTSYRRMTREYFGKTMLEQIGFFAGFTDNLLNQFTENNNEIKIEKVIKSYSYASSKHTIVLDGQELAGSSALSDMTAVITVKNDQLSSLNLSFSALSIIDISVSLGLELNKTNINFSEINNLNPSTYGTILK